MHCIKKPLQAVAGQTAGRKEHLQTTEQVRTAWLASLPIFALNSKGVKAGCPYLMSGVKVS